MSDSDKQLAAIRDSGGRLVVLTERTWHEKIVRVHPDMRRELHRVLAVVESPDHSELDPRPGRMRFYGRAVGPSRWLLAVVSYEQEPARIITAFGVRKDPLLWKP